ncbi:MAG: TlpA family protein disulfide reductase [Armatimonadetes bacterium]|nr:TlpA family protein disulfide reductase [Armatimonadota bacterium]
MQRLKHVALTLAVLALLPLGAADSGPAIGKVAPNFTLKDLSDAAVTLSALKGKVVFLDFWATWCPPCRAALPHTQEISKRQEARKGKLVVLALDQAESKDTVRNFMHRNGYTFRCLLDKDGAVGGKYNVHGIPLFAVIDKHGVVKAVEVGYDEETTPGRIDRAINAALAAR